MHPTVRTVIRLAAVSVVAVSSGVPGAAAASAPDGVGNPVRVIPQDPADNGFSAPVDVDGDTMVTSAVCDDTAGGNCDGSVYVFVRAGDDWVQQRKIVPPDQQPFVEFGRSLAVSGDTIVIGSNEDLPGADHAGTAYVYVRTGTTWSLQAQLHHRNPRIGDQFGWSVAIDGDTIAIGAVRDDIGSVMNAGSAAVFVRTGSTWTEQALLRAADRGDEYEFGTSVAVDGDVVVVGAPDADTEFRAGAGAAYAFDRTGTTWTQRAKLTVPEGADGGDLGQVVALDGDTAVVGGENTTNVDTAHVFVRTAGTWSRQAVLAPRNGTNRDFGQTLDISGDTVVVGDPGDNLRALNGGAVFVYTRSGTQWTRGLRLELQDPVRDDFFGYDVAVDDGLVAVGAVGVAVESVFVYER